jgi:hypothetical protein
MDWENVTQRIQRRQDQSLFPSTMQLPTRYPPGVAEVQYSCDG